VGAVCCAPLCQGPPPVPWGLDIKMPFGRVLVPFLLATGNRCREGSPLAAPHWDYQRTAPQFVQGKQGRLKHD